VTSIPANPGDVLTEVIRNAYGELARVEQLAPEVTQMRPPKANTLPAIFIRPTRREPMLNRNGRWAWLNVRIHTWHTDGYLELNPADLWVGGNRVDPGYLPEHLEHVPLSVAPDTVQQAVRLCQPARGVYQATHRWAVSVAVSK
jgi:hypothetical protein